MLRLATLGSHAVVCRTATKRSGLRFCSTLFKNMENDEPINKKKTVQIGTHDGTFHCDEALACYMLKLLPEYSDAKIIRTRDLEKLKSCDIVVDVGGVYDPSNHRYDHHQRGFNETMSTIDQSLKNFDIKLSSAGLVYAHFGKKILKLKSKVCDDNTIKVLYEKLYSHLIQEIDATDNGIPICEGEQKYRISTNISSRVGDLNPAWNAISVKNVDELFQDAMRMAGETFEDKLNYYLNSWWPAREIVKEAIVNRYKVHESGKIAELPTFVPWKQHYFDLKEELNFDDIDFFLFKDKEWRAIAVPINPDSFICKTYLKEEWRGLKTDELSKVSGIPGCVFCHHTGFIGGNITREGVISMATSSLCL